MAKTIFAFFLFFCGLSAPATPPAYDTATQTAAEDAAGIVWALPVSDGSSDSAGTLRHWNGGTWTSVSVPDAAGFRLLALTRSVNGSAYGLWQKSNTVGTIGPPQCLVTVQRGTGVRILTRFAGTVLQSNVLPNVPEISAGAAGDVWVTGSDPLLRHITPEGTVQTFPLTLDQNFYKLPPFGYPLPQTSSVVDHTGTRWFWQSGPSDWQRGGLRGIFLWDGKSLAYHPSLTGVPDQRVTLIAPLDAGHVWLAVGAGRSDRPPTHGALFRVNTQTLAAVPEKRPQPNSFQNVTQIFEADGDWFLVDQPPGFPWNSSLWRRHAGRWQEVVETLKQTYEGSGSSTKFPWLAEPGGIWVGADSGAWWLPVGGKPALRVDWRRGLPAFSLSGLVPLHSGKVLAFSTQHSSIQNSSIEDSREIAPVPLPIRPLPPGLTTGGLGAPTGIYSLIADAQHHLWGLHTDFAPPPLYTLPRRLVEWDGERWRSHSAPKTILGINGLYDCDTLGRVWLTTMNWHPPAQPQPLYGYAMYDPGHDAWTNYSTIPEALQAAAARPGMAFLPRPSSDPLPHFLGGGKVAYLSENSLLSFYDGEAWHKWHAADIVPGHQYDALSFPKQFSRGDAVEVILDNQRWQWTPENAWQHIGNQEPEQYAGSIPPGGPSGLWRAPTVQDEFGVNWYVWQDAVYTAGYGFWAKQPELSAAGSPFRLGYSIEDVLRDPAGRLFFVSHPAADSDLVVWSPPPTVRPVVSVTLLSEDSASVRFQAALPGRHWFLWRINDSRWSAPSIAETQVFTALPRGKYRVDVEALDARLQVSPPASVIWSVHAAPDTQIQRWVAALKSGPDAAREMAVAGLIKQPAAALPALKAARPAASDLEKWWIDATVQQITAGETPEVAN